MNTKRSIIIGIAGGSASGKTGLALYLQRAFGMQVTCLSQDWYYRDQSHLSAEDAQALNFDHPDAFEDDLLVWQLRALQAGRVVRAPRYDYAAHRRHDDGVCLRPAPIIVVEGLLVLHHPAVRELFDLSIFVDVPADLRLLRRIRRDAVERGIDCEETLHAYEHFVRPMHQQFVQPSAHFATTVWYPETQPDFPAECVAWIEGLREGIAEPHSLFEPPLMEVLA